MQRGDEVQNGNTARPVQWSKVQREAVLAEMNRALADPTFRKSNRCVVLMRRMIELALDGGHEGVKERTLGIEVFGRDCDYDSNSDPIVRMTANEIRKRLAQYYQNDGPRHWVKISLTPGSYIPDFDFLESTFDQDAEKNETLQTPAALSDQPADMKYSGGKLRRLTRISIHRGWAAGAVFLLFAVVAAWTLGRSVFFPSTQYLLWKPLLNSSGSLTLSVADNSVLQDRGLGLMSAEERLQQMRTIAEMIATRNAPSPADPADSTGSTPFVDASVAHQIAGWLGEHDQQTILRPSSALSLRDFRSGSVVLVGGLDNPWTVFTLADLRFSPRVDISTNTYWIRDAQNPTQRSWTRTIVGNVQPGADYAVITRLLDDGANTWVLTVGGFGRHGTEAAGQLLTDPLFARALPAGVRSAKNFQMVVKTNVINGNTGPPQVVAFYAW